MNPIGATRNIIEKLIENFSDFQSYQANMVSSLKNAMDLIGLVRQMRMLEIKKETLRLETVTLKRAFFESYYILKRKFIDKNIEFILDIEDNTQIIAENTSLVNSVLNNLLTNAIKFSYPNSKIIITSESKKKNIQVCVQDFGIGMPSVLLNNIFDVSKSTSRLGTNGENGTGFGMPLIKKFMNFYGGEIEIFSKEKRGKNKDHGTSVFLTFRSPS